MQLLRTSSLLLQCYVAISLLTPNAAQAIEPILFNGDQHRIRYSDGPNGWVEASDEIRAEIQACQTYQCFSDRVREHVSQYRAAQNTAGSHLLQLPPAIRQSVENCSSPGGRPNNETLIDCQLRALGNNISAPAQALRRVMTQMKDEAVKGMALGYSCSHTVRAPAGQCSTTQASCCPNFIQQLSAPESALSQPQTAAPSSPQQTNQRAPGQRSRRNRQPAGFSHCNTGQALDCTNTLMGSLGRRHLDSAGVTSRCWEIKRCEVRNQDAAAEAPFTIALSQTAESRYKDLQAAYLKQMLRQLSVTEASQVRGGCDGVAYDNHVNRIRHMLRGCNFEQAGEAFTAEVTSNEARQRFHAACSSANGAMGVDLNHRIRGQAAKLLRAKCNLKYLREAPSPTLQAAQAQDAVGNINTDTTQHRVVRTNVSIFLDFVRDFNEECGPRGDEIARNDIAKSRVISGRNIQQDLANIVSCAEQISQPGLDARPLPELLALSRESTDPNQFRSYDARRASIGVTQALVDTYGAIRNGIAGVCSNDLQHEYRLNLGELESAVGRQVPFRENFSPELLNLANCSLETRDQGGGRGFFQALSRGCDIVMGVVGGPAISIAAGPEALLAGFCLVSGAANTIAQTDNADALLQLRRRVGPQMDCESASVLARRLTDAQGQLDESRVSTLIQLGVMPLQISTLLTSRHADGAREALAILDGEITAQRRVRSFLSQQGRGQPSVAELERIFPELFQIEGAAADASNTLAELRRLGFTPEQTQRFYQNLADEAAGMRAGARHVGCVVQ